MSLKVHLLLLGLLAAAVSASATPFSALLEEAHGINSWLVDIRRSLHQIPERGSSEFKTSAHLKEILTSLNITFKDGLATTGILATIGTGKPTIALRADIDALPILETMDLPFRSQHAGWMHACGHDAHMTMLLGAAKLLKAHESELPGTVKLMFQPNEEFGAGGNLMVEAGALEGVDAVFGMHVMPTIPTGVLATRRGAIMAGALSFSLTVRGRGGHAALPHLNVDPVVAAAHVITALQTLVSRETSPLGSSVISVTMLRAGDAYNVIPDTATLGGTIRALDPRIMDRLRARVQELSASVAAGFGCTAEVDWRLDEQPYYPPTVNDAATADFTRSVAARLLGEDNSQDTEPIMAGEDFAFYCQKVPCTFAFVGIRNETLGSVHALHNPKFLLDETVLPKGAAMHAAWAWEYLQTSAAAAAAAAAGAKDEL